MCRFTKLLNLATRAELAASGLANDRRVAFVPISELINDIAARPADYGFDVVDGNACTTSDYACEPGARVAPDADRAYVFAACLRPISTAVGGRHRLAVPWRW